MYPIAWKTEKLEQARTTLRRLEDLSLDYNGNNPDMLNLALDLARIQVTAIEEILAIIEQNRSRPTVSNS